MNIAKASAANIGRVTKGLGVASALLSLPEVICNPCQLDGYVHLGLGAAAVLTGPVGGLVCLTGAVLYDVYASNNNDFRYRDVRNIYKDVRRNF